jgi:hypothetical protein
MNWYILGIFIGFLYSFILSVKLYQIHWEDSIILHRTLAAFLSLCACREQMALT